MGNEDTDLEQHMDDNDAHTDKYSEFEIINDDDFESAEDGSLEKQPEEEVFRLTFPDNEIIGQDDKEDGELSQDTEEEEEEEEEEADDEDESAKRSCSIASAAQQALDKMRGQLNHLQHQKDVADLEQTPQILVHLVELVLGVKDA